MGSFEDFQTRRKVSKAALIAERGKTISRHLQLIRKIRKTSERITLSKQ